MNAWGNGMFMGGFTQFGTGFTRDSAGTTAIHASGMVTNYGAGFGFYFATCSDLSKYTGISFKIKGMTNAAGVVQFQLQTNEDYPWQPRLADMKGGCTATTVATAYTECQPPAKNVPVAAAEATVTVSFADLMGGMPKTTADVTQVVGFQWQMPWSETATAYAADVTVSDVVLTGGTGAPVSCDMSAAGGSGGTGGTGAGGTAGSAGSGGTGG